MNTEIFILTKEDLDSFKKDLISEIKGLLKTKVEKAQWLRSSDVREMLSVSDSTLQAMRINKTIPAYKLDTTWFYKYEEIVSALEKGKNR